MATLVQIVEAIRLNQEMARETLGRMQALSTFSSGLVEQLEVLGKGAELAPAVLDLQLAIANQHRSLTEAFAKQLESFDIMTRGHEAMMFNALKLTQTAEASIAPLLQLQSMGNPPVSDLAAAVAAERVPDRGSESRPK